MIEAKRARDAYLGLGSNVGDRLHFLNKALSFLRTLDDTSFVTASHVYESEALVGPGQGAAPNFLNGVVLIRTAIDPEILLAKCLGVERDLGRIRGAERWLPRTIDIDILLIDGMSLSDDRLTLPHPRMHERRFVLLPICDIDPDLHVPVPFDAPAKDLLASCGVSAPVFLHADFDRATQQWHALHRTAASQ